MILYFDDRSQCGIKFLLFSEISVENIISLSCSFLPFTTKSFGIFGIEHNLSFNSSETLLSFSCNSLALGLSDMDLLLSSSASLLFPDLNNIPISFVMVLDSFNIESYSD